MKMFSIRSFAHEKLTNYFKYSISKLANHFGDVSRISDDEKEYFLSIIEDLKRRNREYFDVIASIEKERNSWIDLFYEQASEHLAAQTMLETQLINIRRQAVRAIQMLNEKRKKDGLEPIKSTSDLLPYDGEPVGLAEKYAIRMKELHDAMPKKIDGNTERERILKS